ncbi:putative cytochrome P450 oxidoreductase [Daldinia decipiens]|uniref:putative cytochrome P450 oxidoreductase n=1 Tax=Daldinia decipiens TaxID=326647 RepID=UPI0020C4F363|nr:putative cytochrome P450 oxidoreductase [Daldinia decipiens]KAI1657788.1 putative cytochrome P450 oxidoreductase [Daldinia decipiens]
MEYDLNAIFKMEQSQTLLYIFLPFLLTWTLWRFWKFTVTPLLHPDRPRELPYLIPILGHGPAFFKSSDALLFRASKYFGTKEPFAVTLFGSTMYIVTHPQHTVQVYKNDKTLSFDEFAQDLVRTNGYSNAAVRASYADQPKDKAGFPNPLGVSFGAFVRQMHIHQLYPGENLEVIEKQFIEWYEKNLTIQALQKACEGYLITGGDEENITIPLMHWISSYTTNAGGFAYFGDTLSFINPDLAKTFIEFDDVSWQVLYRYPAFLSSKMRSTRMEIMKAFREYLRLPQTERTGSVWLLNAMEDEARAIGVADEDIAVLYFNIYWLINTNTRKINFWLLAFLLCRNSSLIDCIRSETGPAFQGDILVDVAFLYNSCPTLDNVWHESLRLCSNAASVRFIRDDTIIGGKHMHRGNRIMIPYRLLHFDENVYGADVYSFHPERFASGEEAKKDDPTRGPSWRPFGGGKSLCTGRYIAKRATLIFVALVLRRFNIEIIGEPRLPEADLGRPVLGISGLKEGQDFLVKLTPRE